MRKAFGHDISAVPLPLAITASVASTASSVEERAHNWNQSEIADEFERLFFRIGHGFSNSDTYENRNGGGASALFFFVACGPLLGLTAPHANSLL